MKIAHILPGVGNTSVCVNCLRDGVLLNEFQKQGYEVLAVPLYLPFRPNGEDPISGSPIFFGGINSYLQQKSVIFRKTPRFIDRLFDNRRLLEWASRKFQMDNATLLGSMTLSMLKGREGNQVKECDRLLNWLCREGNRPDVVCISNALLAGLAKPLREKLGVPIVCLLHDEDKFIDDLPEPYDGQVWEVLAECANAIDAFIAISESYSESIKRKLGIGDDKMYVAQVCDNVDSDTLLCNVGTIAVKIAELFATITKDYTKV